MEYLKKKLSSKKKSSQSQPESQPPPSDPQQPKLYEPHLDAPAPKGILKNRDDAAKYTNTDALPTSNDIDESLRNAQKNSSLNQSLGATPQNEEVKESVLADPMINPDGKHKDIRWDEANLEKNEEEKVPRMKIDEPPTPYAERPEELQYGDELMEEVILDEDYMAMSNEDDIDLNEAELVHSEKTLDQKQQSLLLGDDAFRQKMVDDAISRRQKGGDNDSSIKSSSKRKIPRSAWEMDDDDSTPTLSGGSGSNSMSPEDEEQRAKKRKFENKRKAHYNEFHAIKAFKAKQAALEAAGNNDENAENNDAQ